MNHYDVIVIGVGAMGSATIYELTNQGLSVLGIEQDNIPNDIGSSHGITRIIRLAYYEHTSYVPLLRKAYKLWRDLEKRTGKRILVTTGSIDASREGDEVFRGSKYSCDIHNLEHEVWDSREISDRFPGYQLPNDVIGLYQPEGGILLPEECIVAYVNVALELGAEIHGREQVISWSPKGDGVTVKTNKSEYSSKKLVITAGAWTSKLIPELKELAIPERQVLAWFHPRRPELFTPSTFPVMNILVDEGRYYGFPAYGIPGFKVGRYHHRGENVDPDTMERNPDNEDEILLRSFTDRYFPDASGPTVALKTCMFTNSPDEHFILDFHPEWPQVCIAAGFSGHGFKFASVVGEIMSELVCDGRSHHNLDLFKLDRFNTQKDGVICESD